MTTLYPRGYGKQLVSLADLIREYHPKMHPEFSRRLFPWLGLSGPPYVGSMKGVQGAKELLGIWPALVRRELVESQVEIAVEKV